MQTTASSLIFLVLFFHSDDLASDSVSTDTFLCFHILKLYIVKTPTLWNTALHAIKLLWLIYKTHSTTITNISFFLCCLWSVIQTLFIQRAVDHSFAKRQTFRIGEENKPTQTKQFQNYKNSTTHTENSTPMSLPSQMALRRPRSLMHSDALLNEHFFSIYIYAKQDAKWVILLSVLCLHKRHCFGCMLRRCCEDSTRIVCQPKVMRSWTWTNWSKATETTTPAKMQTNKLEKLLFAMLSKPQG